MYTTGNVTIFVSDMSRSVDFYTKTLGLELQSRHGDHWAEVRTPADLVIGLHPASKDAPPPGTPGAMHIGLHLEGSMDAAIETLTGRGVSFEKVIEDDGVGRFAYLHDPDGNRIYLWEPSAALREEIESRG